VGDLVEDLIADLSVDDFAHVHLVAEHERHVEHVHVWHHQPDDAEAAPGHLYRADLGLFDDLFFEPSTPPANILKVSLPLLSAIRVLPSCSSATTVG